jgi:hypothetical protein
VTRIVFKRHTFLDLADSLAEPDAGAASILIREFDDGGRIWLEGTRGDRMYGISKMIKNFGDHSANERTFLSWVRTACLPVAARKGRRPDGGGPQAVAVFEVLPRRHMDPPFLYLSHALVTK